MTTILKQTSIQNGFCAERDHSLIEKAKMLRPLLSKYAQQHEDQRELAPEVVEELKKAEFWKMAAPYRWGGLSTSAYAMARVGAELAKGCPSTAWVIGVMNSGVWLASIMPDVLQEEVFANGIPTVSSVGTPPGKAVKVDGGYRVTGAWNYGSGSHHAEWLNCPLAEPDGAEGPGGLFMTRRSDLEILPTWEVSGMKGTGSDTIAANDLFVPEHRTVWHRNGGIGPDRPNANHSGEATDYWAMMPLLRSKGLGALVGTAEALLEIAIGETKNRPIVHTKYKRKGDSAVYAAGIGEAAAAIRTAGFLMDRRSRPSRWCNFGCGRGPSSGGFGGDV